MQIKPPLRKEGRAKVTGRTHYIDDIRFPDMIYGTTVRSPVPRGRIRDIAFEGNIPWDEFTIVTAKDIPGKNHVALIEYDQPFLADNEVNHPEEPIVLLAHHDKYLLEEARRHVRIEIDPLPATFTIDEALATGRVMKAYLVEKGNIADAWKHAAHIVEGEYFTGAQEQLYIENNGVIAIASPGDGVTVWGSMQCPYYVHKGLLPLFNLPEDKIRIIQTETGGGFGGKEEYPTLISGHAALLAWRSGKPVKIIYDRAEDMVATTKRHPSRTRFKTAVNSDGKLLGMHIDFVIDGGAYVTLSPVVLSRGTIHSAGPYLCPNVRIDSKAVFTNHPPHGAFRGFGAPQSIFGLERHMDQIAATLGLEPDEFRRRNFIKTGQTTATSQIIREPVDMDKLLEKALSVSRFHEKRKKFAAENPSNTIKKGIGLASFMHGAGFTGSGEKALASVVGIEATADGNLRVLAASTEIGQGTNTVFSQIVANALGLEYEMVEVAQPDTRNVPNSGPTVASRTVMVVGGLIEKAAISLRDTLVQSGFLLATYTSADFQKACRDYLAKFGALKQYTQYKQPPNVDWDDKKYQGDAYATYAWAVYIAEVSVDTVTYDTRVDDFWAVQEVGKVIHPVLAAGQIEGGVAQGVGYALYEKVVWRDGRMANGQMTNYIMPTAADVPNIHVIFEELGSAYGPGGGAKGIGELPMDGPGPAILNAIENAVGVNPNHIPFLPEDLARLLK